MNIQRRTAGNGIVRITAAVIISVCVFSPVHSWELSQDEQGIKIYTQEFPGSSIREFRAEMTVKSSLASLIASLDDVASYKDWQFNCQGARILREVNPVERYTYVTNGAPWPVGNRDMVIHSVLKQDPRSGIVTIYLENVPGYLPPQPDFVRINQLTGIWQFIPKGGGLVTVIYQLHVDPGGSVPSTFINSSLTKNPFGTLSKMREILTRDKYAKAKYPNIQER